MGRKIPAKKHRGVKDPVKQQATRFESIKDKINAPPIDPDEQPVPRSLQRLFAFKEPRTPASILKKKKRSLAAVKRDDNPVAALKRMPGEAGRAFSMRINSAVRALHSTDQEDYPLDLEETDTRGEYIASQRERRQKKHRQAAARDAKGKGLKGEELSGKGGGERLSKSQRRALKKKEQQKAKETETRTVRELEAREVRYERVAFGDVAHAPPALPTPRRALSSQGAPRPGRRDLLLAAMLKPSQKAPSTQVSKAQPSKKTQAKAQINAAEAMRRERARLEAVDAYRALKKQKMAEKKR